MEKYFENIRAEIAELHELNKQNLIGIKVTEIHINRIENILNALLDRVKKITG